MEHKGGRTEQRHVKPGDSLRAKAVAGASVADGGVVVEVREKKGPLRAAIPTMPFSLAVICLLLNTLIPGLGKCGQIWPVSFCLILVQIKRKRAELKQWNWRSAEGVRTAQVCGVYSGGAGRDKQTATRQISVRCWVALGGGFTRKTRKMAAELARWDEQHFYYFSSRTNFLLTWVETLLLFSFCQWS